MQTVHGQHIPPPDVDENGYLVDAQAWTPDVAEELARNEVPDGLTDDHWKVIVHMRQYYLEFGTVPPVRMLSRQTGFTLRQMKKMFPNGLANGACKIAGIPRDVIKPSFLYP